MPISGKPDRSNPDAMQTKPSIILGIDPGPKKTSMVLWRTEKKVIYQTWIFDLSPDGRYTDQYGDPPRLPILPPDVIAYEMPIPYPKAGKDITETAFECGCLIGILNPDGAIPRKPIYRATIKSHFGIKRGVDADAAIRKILINICGKAQTKGITSHLWSALAVAITAADMSKT